MPFKADTTDELGSMLRRARHSQDPRLTQEDVAAAMNVGQSTISAWEAGRARPNLPDLERLARLLSLDVAKLVSAAARAAERNGHT